MRPQACGVGSDPASGSGCACAREDEDGDDGEDGDDDEGGDDDEDEGVITLCTARTSPPCLKEFAG